MQRPLLIDRTYYEDMKRSEEAINHYEDMIQSIRKKEYELQPKIKEKESEMAVIAVVPNALPQL